MKTRKPKKGAEVVFVLEKGQRFATVTNVWTRPVDIALLAERYGTSVEAMVESHRLRASLEVQTAPEDGLPNPYYVTHAEYDEAGRVGSWHYKP